MRTLLATLAMFAAAVASGAKADDIHLACDGAARFQTLGAGFGFANGSRGGFASGSSYSTGQGQTPDEFLVEITGTTGKVKVPSSLWPQLHGDLHDGWVQLKTLEVKNDEIDATYSLNAFDTHVVTISRQTGHMDVRAPAQRGFSGDCHAYDPAASRKF